MALRTNSKKAMENLHNYIRNYCEEYLQEYDIPATEITTKSGLYSAIYRVFASEMRIDDCTSWYYRRTRSEFSTFKDWAQGLAMGGLFCYYYNRRAVDDVAAILEETEEEKAKFTEDKAEELLTSIIYREIRKGANV